MVKRHHARVLVTHGPTVAAWCALFARLLRIRAPIFAHTFNFTQIPSPVKRRVFGLLFRNVSKFVVFSTMERDLYSRVFRLPPERFDVVLWGVRPPAVTQPDAPLERKPYICAIGGNARDYRTLLDAAGRLPYVRFVVVVRPENLRGLTVPNNVAVHTNIPVGAAMNILFHSSFMVLPLMGSQVPCGHVTLVAAMHLSKAMVITDSSGVRDYARHGENALIVPTGSTSDLVSAIQKLWTDAALCAQLGKNGKDFAAHECSEARIVEHFRLWLESNHIGTKTLPMALHAANCPD